MKNPLSKAPTPAQNSMRLLVGHDVYAGRSGIIRQAAAKMRGNPPTWRTARQHGGVSIVIIPRTPV